MRQYEREVVRSRHKQMLPWVGCEMDGCRYERRIELLVAELDEYKQNLESANEQAARGEQLEVENAKLMQTCVKSTELQAALRESQRESELLGKQVTQLEETNMNVSDQCRRYQELLHDTQTTLQNQRDVVEILNETIEKNAMIDREQSPRGNNLGMDALARQMEALAKQLNDCELETAAKKAAEEVAAAKKTAEDAVAAKKAAEDAMAAQKAAEEAAAAKKAAEEAAAAKKAVEEAAANKAVEDAAAATMAAEEIAAAQKATADAAEAKKAAEEAAAAKKTAADEAAAMRQAAEDEVAAVRKAAEDEAAAMKKAVVDEVAAVRKAAADTAEARKTAEETAAAKKTAEDAAAAMRQAAEDEVAAVRKAAQGEVAAMHKAAEDEVAAVRKAAKGEVAAMHKAAEEEAAAAKVAKIAEEAAVAQKVAEEEAAAKKVAEDGAAAKAAEEEAAAAAKAADKEVAAAKAVEEEVAAAKAAEREAAHELAAQEEVDTTFTPVSPARHLAEVTSAGEWFVCDKCEKAIFPGTYFFQSKAQEDYTLCSKCHRKMTETSLKVGKAVRKFSKKKVPKGCEPPRNWQELVREASIRESEAASVAAVASETEEGIVCAVLETNDMQQVANSKASDEEEELNIFDDPVTTRKKKKAWNEGFVTGMKSPKSPKKKFHEKCSEQVAASDDLSAAEVKKAYDAGVAAGVAHAGISPAFSRKVSAALTEKQPKHRDADEVTLDFSSLDAASGEVVKEVPEEPAPGEV